jgi:hypothetical protein
VNGDGAYEGEMNEVALFERAVRAAVPTQPDPRLGAALVPRLAHVARAATIDTETHATRRRAPFGARRRSRSRLALVARVGIAVALIPLVLAGLAFAGVNLPAPARDAFDSVGITLPNQPSSESDKSTPQSQGQSKSTGNEVSDAAKRANESPEQGNSAAAHKHARDQRAKARGKALGHSRGKALGHSRGKAIGLNEATPPGQSGDTGPPDHSNAGGSSSSSAAPQGSGSSRPFPPGIARGQSGTPSGNAKGHSK